MLFHNSHSESPVHDLLYTYVYIYTHNVGPLIERNEEARVQMQKEIA